MLAIFLCVVAFLATMWAGKRSLGQGALALLTVGYFYGILRANIPSAASHFIFDAGVVGLYLSQKWSRTAREITRSGDVWTWTTLLIAWPCILFVVPDQPLMVRVIGLRGHIFFLPLLVLGSRLTSKDLRLLAFGLAILNLISLGMGITEYVKGIETFFPKNEVTVTMYNSRDLAGGASRIPSFFTSAHAYAGAMVMTIPLLFGAWAQKSQTSFRKHLLMLGMVAAIFGVLMSATRVNFIAVAVLALVITVSSDLSGGKRAAWLAALAIAVVITSANDRLQRFTTLQDSKMISDRFDGSVNSDFISVLGQYPFGNGLGGGGTSMPYFLQSQVKNPVVVLENEYARILVEQGAIGLAFWMVFAGWHLLRRSAFEKSQWRAGRLVAWYACTLSFAIGLIGIGLLTAIPQTAMFLLSLGWISASQAPEMHRRGPQNHSAFRFSTRDADAVGTV